MPELTKVRVSAIGELVVDAFGTESHEHTATVTKHKVEKGSPISDHIATESPLLNVEGIVSDTPIGAVAINRNVIVGDALDAEDDKSYSDLAAEYLKKLWETKQLVVIETSRGTYRSMACTSLSFPVDASTGFALRFSATFQELRIIENVRVRRPVGEKRAAGRSRKARQAKAAKEMTARLQKTLNDIGFQRREVQWDKGSPPGSSNIVEREMVYYATIAGVSQGVWFHSEDNTKLSTIDLWAFEKDRTRTASEIVARSRAGATGGSSSGAGAGSSWGGVDKNVPKSNPRSAPKPTANMFGDRVSNIRR